MDQGQAKWVIGRLWCMSGATVAQRIFLNKRVAPVLLVLFVTGRQLVIWRTGGGADA
jgi:hypothetical protein